MGSIVLRSFAEANGLEWRPEVASIVDGRPVTWSEVHARRNALQEQILFWKRRPDRLPRVAAWVWVFLNETEFYDGWYCYLVWIENGGVHRHAVNFRDFRRDLAVNLMRAFPCGRLQFGDTEEEFGRWMEWFANQYPRRKTKRDRRRAGSAFCWWDRATDAIDLA